MATYYWVGGAGTWNAITTTNWASSSGGAGGAGVPTSADNVIFDSGSGAAPVVIIAAAVCSACTVGAPTSGTLTFAFGVSTLTAAGNITFTTTVSITGTGTITQSSVTPTFAGNGNTFYNLSFSSAALTSGAITGANTFNNVTFATKTGVTLATISITGNQTILGTLTTASTNATTRLALVSATLGTPVTLTAAVVSLSDTDLRDITGAGAATWSGTRLGDGLGNSGITFANAKTVYWNLVAGGNWSSNAWALTSGAGPAIDNFPLAQDTVVIENTGLTAGNTITMNSSWYVGTIDMGTRSTAMTFTSSQSISIYQDLTLSSSVTTTGSGPYNFVGRGRTQVLTTAGVTLTQAFNINNINGIVRLGGACTTGSVTITHTSGTFDLNNYTLTTAAFVSNNSNVRTLAFGTGNIVVSFNNFTIWNTSTTTNLTVTGTPVVNATYNGATGTRTISFGALSEANSISLNVSAGTDIVALTATGGFKNLVFTGFAGTLTNTAMTIYGNLTLASGMTLTSGTSTTTFAATSGTKTITTATKTINFPLTFNGSGGTFAFQDALTQGSTRAFTITNGTVQLKNGVTSTVGGFATSGTTQKILESTLAGSQATLSQASGTVNANSLTIKDINATGGATWNSLWSNNNVDAGNNTGWVFGDPPITLATEYTYALRSFTQPRRF
jgi:hypothetical protein